MGSDERAVELPPRARDGRPRVLPTLAMIATVIVCVAAGNWQRGRMEAKQSLRAQLEVAGAAAAVELPANVVDWTAWRFRPVVASGTFDDKRQILIDNRVHARVVGYAVVTPLRLEDGRVVMVDRGFVPGGPTRDALPAVPPPDGRVTVRGRVNLVPTGYFELARTDARGPVWQQLDLARYTAATGIAVMPIVIEATAPTGEADRALARDRAPPDLGIDKHRIYMWQWYTFAAMALGLWLWFALRRSGAHESRSVVP